MPTGKGWRVVDEGRQVNVADTVHTARHRVAVGHDGRGHVYEVVLTEEARAVIALS